MRVLGKKKKQEINFLEANNLKNKNKIISLKFNFILKLLVMLIVLKI